jgi:hypothetical protein
MRWRPALFWLHRDLGYLAFGLTVVYALSGIAVNHRHHWDYNRSGRLVESRVGSPAELIADLGPERRRFLEANPTSLEPAEEQGLVVGLAHALGRALPPKNAFWRGPRRFSVFFQTGDRDTVDYDPVSGVARHLALKDRWVFREVNFLHLNERHGGWTWFADAYALALLFLAVSGVVMVKGKNGVTGRKGILVATGVAVPLVALLLMRWL